MGHPCADPPAPPYLRKTHSPGSFWVSRHRGIVQIMYYRLLRFEHPLEPPRLVALDVPAAQGTPDAKPGLAAEQAVTALALTRAVMPQALKPQRHALWLVGGAELRVSAHPWLEAMEPPALELQRGLAARVRAELQAEHRAEATFDCDSFAFFGHLREGEGSALTGAEAALSEVSAPFGAVPGERVLALGRLWGCGQNLDALSERADGLGAELCAQRAVPPPGLLLALCDLVGVLAQVHFRIPVRWIEAEEPYTPPLFALTGARGEDRFIPVGTLCCDALAAPQWPTVAELARRAEAAAAER